MCLTTIIFALVLLACVLDQESLTRDDWVALSTCRECSYSLEGLPGSAPCPECGAVNPGARPGRVVEWRYVFRPRRPGFLMFCVVFLLASAIGLNPLAREIFAALYVADGYTWAVGRRAATVRVLRGGETLEPAYWMIALLPLCGFARKPVRTWGFAFAMILAALMLGAVRLSLSR